MRHTLTGVLAAAALAVGCGTTPAAPPDVTYPAPDVRTWDERPVAADASPDAAVDAPPGDATAQCRVDAPTSCPEAPPRYGDVAPIFRQRCATCHSGSTDEWPLNTYGHVADWQNEIRDRLVTCTMPPPDAGVTITERERDAVLVWLRCGLPM